jgi:hypothetical protein
MTGNIRPLRLFIKAVFFFVAANSIFAMTNPPVGKLTLYNHIFPGRQRFPYEQEPRFYFLGFNAPVYEDFDAMFGAHEISKKKMNNEFRLVLLGDSSTWGITVQPGDMLSEQMNGYAINTCDGRKVHIYNLGYPMPFLMKDLLILDKALEYEPDMIVWLITLSTLEPKKAETYFILPHADRYLSLLERYDLPPLELAEPIPEKTFFDRTIIGQRRRLKDIFFVQAMGVPWAATGVDNHEGLEQVSHTPPPDVEDDPSYEKMLPGDDTLVFFDSLMLDIISAGYSMAGDAPVVLVNQPIFIADGLNSEMRYNETYPRWIYDEYRRFIFDWTNEREQIYLDFWDVLPSSDFADRNFHRNASGEKRFADLLVPELQKLVCH